MPERPADERRRIEVSGVQVAGSALAAVSSAFLLSTLGVAGTVIGAALASVVATVGSAIYVHLFRRTSDQLRDVRSHLTSSGAPSADPSAVPDRPSGSAVDPSPGDPTVILPVGGHDGPVPLPGTPPDTLPGDTAADRGTGGTGGDAPSGGRRWLVRSVVGAVAVFALAMGVITVTETAIGRSLASLFGHGDGGRPTISRVFHEDSSDTTPRTPPADDGTGDTQAPGSSEGSTSEDGSGTGETPGDGSGDRGPHDGTGDDGTSPQGPGTASPGTGDGRPTAPGGSDGSGPGAPAPGPSGGTTPGSGSDAGSGSGSGPEGGSGDGSDSGADSGSGSGSGPGGGQEGTGDSAGTDPGTGDNGQAPRNAPGAAGDRATGAAS